MEPSPKKLVIDCDAGTDDAQAIMIALANEDKGKIVAITTVFGNAPLENTTRNVLRLLNFCKRTDIPVYGGSKTTLTGKPDVGDGYHGQDGFGDVPQLYLSSNTNLKTEHAVNCLVRMAQEQKGELTVVALGPLTNIALAIQMDSDFLNNLKDFFIMGGNTTGRGNITSTAEFNFFSDPEAAKYVFQFTKEPTYVIPMELCEENSFEWSWYNNFCKIDTPKAKFVKDIDAFMVTAAKKSGSPKYWTWDQLAISVALDQSIIIESRDVAATVETQGEFTRGQMVVDWRNRAEKRENIKLVTKVDMDKYEKLIHSAVA